MNIEPSQPYHKVDFLQVHFQKITKLWLLTNIHAILKIKTLIFSILMEKHQSSQKACNELLCFCRKPTAEDDSKITSSAYIKQSILLLFGIYRILGGQEVIRQIICEKFE